LGIAVVLGGNIGVAVEQDQAKGGLRKNRRNVADPKLDGRRGDNDGLD
jgi:hypothetical protein